MQLVAGRTAQEYNRRKERKGAFWEDRYHATAVDTEGYLSRCMVYIDLNMVRAGVVKHPSEWSMSGYHEIQNPFTRYTVIDQPALLEVFEIRNIDQRQKVCRDWVDEDLRSKQQTRDGNWSTSLAVGRPEFIDVFKTELGLIGIYRGSAGRICTGTQRTDGFLPPLFRKENGPFKRGKHPIFWAISGFANQASLAMWLFYRAFYKFHRVRILLWICTGNLRAKTLSFFGRTPCGQSVNFLRNVGLTRGQHPCCPQVSPTNSPFAHTTP